MAFRRLFPYAAGAALSGYVGWEFGQESVYRKARTDPGSVIDRAAQGAVNPAAVYAAMVVQAANRSGSLGMFGCAFTDVLTQEPTRRTILANVYSRLAGGATVMALRESERGLQMLLVVNKRRESDHLYPSEGWGQWGPPKGVGEHFSDVKEIDRPEVLILKGMSVQEAYQKEALAHGRGQFKYGSFDKSFYDNAIREFSEELGIRLRKEDLTLICQDSTWAEKQSLQKEVAWFLTILNDGFESLLVPDHDEIASVHFIDYAEVRVEADGRGRVKDFIIAASYMPNIAKAALRYEEVQLAKMSDGRIQTLAELEKYAEKLGLECPRLVPFGPEYAVSSQALRSFAKSIIASLDVSLGCTPFLKAGSGLPTPTKDSKSELTG